MNETELNVFSNLVESAFSEEKRVKSVDQWEKHPTFGLHFSDMKGKPEALSDFVEKVCLPFFKKEISRKSQTEMRKLLTRAYSENSEAFEKFFRLNMVRENVFSEEFQLLWAPVAERLREAEDELVKNMENGSKYGKYSGSVSEKFRALAKGFFPYVEYVGAVIRKA